MSSNDRNTNKRKAMESNTELLNICDENSNHANDANTIQNTAECCTEHTSGRNNSVEESQRDINEEMTGIVESPKSQEIINEKNEEDSLVITTSFSDNDYIGKAETLFKSEEFCNYVETQKRLDTTINSLRLLMLTVRNSAFGFQNFLADFNDLITQSGWIRKDFDIIGLFQNPDESIIAKDWFESIIRGVELVDKAAKCEVDSDLGRVPPRTFRACLKLASRFDPVTTLSTLTPMFTLKKELSDATLAYAIQRCATGFYNYAKWMLSTERKITVELLKTLNLTEEIDVLYNSLRSSAKEKLSRIYRELSTSICELSSNDIDWLETASEHLIEESGNLYDKTEHYSAAKSLLKKSFFKIALSDIFKMYNDISKAIDKFAKDTKDIVASEDKEVWNDLMFKMKNRIEEFLASLDIYKNPAVIEDVTIWDDTMDYVEIIDAEEEEGRELGMISQVHSIGFYVANGEGPKDYIEKTKVTVYRNPQS